jgi:protein gp37/5-methylcytosine-specific restriction endonuclease McrA
MAENSKIEWTHHTFNPWRGCTKVSPGCANCYAETMSGRNPATLGVWGPRGTRVVAAESYWRQPLKWDRDAKAAGERRRVFCASLADVFEGLETMPREEWPKVAEARARLMCEVIPATPNLDWLLLTKRPANAVLDGFRPLHWAGRWPDNVWLGVSVEDQQRADERIPELLKVPAAVRFLSVEPLLGAVDLRPWLSRRFAIWTDCDDQTHAAREPGGLHWVIVGGESGPGARPCRVEWARSIWSNSAGRRGCLCSSSNSVPPTRCETRQATYACEPRGRENPEADRPQGWRTRPSGPPTCASASSRLRADSGRLPGRSIFSCPLMPSRPSTLRLPCSPQCPADPRPSPSRRGYGRDWQRVRAAKLAADPWCEDCGEPATEVDHVLALSAGGTHDADNLRSLCHACHTRKTNAVDGGLGRPKVR